MTMLQTRASLGLLSCIATLALAGCASMFNPHVELENRPQSGASLDNAIEYANEVKDQYREALGDRAQFNNLLGAGLIPLGAVTLGLAVADVSSTAVTVLGLTGATAYGLGVYFDRDAEEQAFILAYNAINCAIEAVLPMNFRGASDEEYKQFKEAFESIDEKIKDVETKIGSVRSALARLQTEKPAETPLTGGAGDSIVAAEAIVTNSLSARRNAASLRREAAIAGDRLVSAVDRIVGQVDTVINENQPGVEAVATIIGGLGSAYAQFTTVPESMVSAKDIAAPTADEQIQAATGEEEILIGGLEKLQVATAELGIGVRQVADFVNAIVSKKPVETLRNCGVDPARIAADITINPAGPVIVTAGTRSSLAFVIDGGSQPYRAMLTEADVTGINVTQPNLFGPAFSVNVNAEAKPGQYSVYAADGTGRQAIMQVIVQSTEPAAGSAKEPAASDEAPPAPEPAAFRDLTEEEKKKLQAAIGLTGDDIDGDWGPRTAEKLIEYQRANDPPADGKLTCERAHKVIHPDSNQETRANKCKSTLMKLAETILGTVIKFDDNDLELAVEETDILDGTELRVTLKGVRKASVTVDENNVKEQIRAQGGAEAETVDLSSIVIVNDITESLKAP